MSAIIEVNITILQYYYNAQAKDDESEYKISWSCLALEFISGTSTSYCVSIATFDHAEF